MTATRRINEPGTFDRMTINLPKDLKVWLQHAAVDQHTTASDLITKALLEYRAKREKKSK